MSFKMKKSTRATVDNLNSAEQFHVYRGLLNFDTVTDFFFFFHRKNKCWAATFSPFPTMYYFIIRQRS